MRLIKDLKKSAKEYVGKGAEVKEKAQATGESLKRQIEHVKQETDERLAPIKDVSEGQLSALKKEARDLKKVFDSKDLVFVKTDTIAVVLRKLGGLDEFLTAVDQLTKEGYRMVLKEEVRDIPLPMGFKVPLGTFYYFQKAKYIT